jgi:uncharacterized membrane protein YhaH (DUF805 family)
MMSVVQLVGTASVVLALLVVASSVTVVLARRLSSMGAEQATEGIWLLVVSIPFMGFGIAIYLAATSFDLPVPAGETTRLIQGMAAILTGVGLMSACIACVLVFVQTARHPRTR